MADPSPIEPYNDPHETDYMDEVLYILNNQNPILDDFNTDEIPFLYPESADQIDDHTIDPLEDPFIRDFCNEPEPRNSQEAPLGGMDDNYQTETNFEYNVYSMPLSVWPINPVPYNCSCCQSLRQIVHTNGFGVTKLEIHGTLGMICHAILTVEPGPRFQMFDFSKKSIEDVKQFLIQYCMDRSQAGFTMIKDPLSIFYEALCVGFGWDDSFYNDNDFIPPSSSNSDRWNTGGIQMDRAGTSHNQERSAKRSLAIQRERTRNLTLKQLENYFHLPINQAAKRMEFSATVVKRICRKYGLDRWPHRKIHSMEKQISNWESRLSSNDPAERARAENEIERLRREIAKFGEGTGNLGDDDD